MSPGEFFQSGRPFALCYFPQEQDTRSVYQTFTDLPDHRFVYAPFPTATDRQDVFPDQAEYEALIGGALAAIHQGEFKKVVLSRMKRVIRDRSTLPLEIFERLAERYPQAMVYAFRRENGDLWMGASPELLLRKRGHRFETVALAGTQPLRVGMSLEEYEWGTKELEEHELVVSFIRTTLMEAGASQIVIGSPVSSPAGQVVHRKTPVTFESDRPVMEWVSLLHPTPAVCGTPRNAALEYIRAHEPHSRDLYSGVIGRVQENGDADLYVNLRCMRVMDEAVVIYVGGGINKGSVPHREWEETELKAQTLIRVLE